jgi:hypothetical protein
VRPATSSSSRRPRPKPASARAYGIPIIPDPDFDIRNNYFIIFFGGLQCVGHSFAYVAHFEFFRDVWIRTQRAAVPSRRASNLATYSISLKLSHPSPSYEIIDFSFCFGHVLKILFKYDTFVTI